MKMSLDERRALKEGVQIFLPMLPVIAIWGGVIGIAMGQSSLTFWQSIGMSIFVFAGSAQLATLPLFAADAPIWTIFVTSLLVNCRFLIFSAGLATHFSYLSLLRRMMLAFLNMDVIYMLFTKQNLPPDPTPGKAHLYLGIGVSGFIIWQLASITGIAISSFLPREWGLDFAGTLVLIPLVLGALRTRVAVIAVFAAIAVAIGLFSLPYKLSLTLAVLTAMIVGIGLDFLKEQKVKQVQSDEQNSEMQSNQNIDLISTKDSIEK